MAGQRTADRFRSPRSPSARRHDELKRPLRWISAVRSPSALATSDRNVVLPRVAAFFLLPLLLTLSSSSSASPITFVSVAVFYALKVRLFWSILFFRRLFDSIAKISACLLLARSLLLRRRPLVLLHIGSHKNLSFYPFLGRFFWEREYTGSFGLLFVVSHL